MIIFLYLKKHYLQSTWKKDSKMHLHFITEYKLQWNENIINKISLKLNWGESSVRGSKWSEDLENSGKHRFHWADWEKMSPILITWSPLFWSHDHLYSDHMITSILITWCRLVSGSMPEAGMKMSTTMVQPTSWSTWLSRYEYVWILKR